MIRPAVQEEADTLTTLSFESKNYWNYPDAYFRVWEKELTITGDYITQNDVFVYELAGRIIGYFSVVNLKTDIRVSGILIEKGYWLEHMFIKPAYIGKKIGSNMFRYLRKYCHDKGIQKLGILADPHSKKFYEKMGCKYVGEFPSTIENRTTPYLVLLNTGKSV